MRRFRLYPGGYDEKNYISILRNSYDCWRPSCFLREKRRSARTWKVRAMPHGKTKETTTPTLQSLQALLSL